MTASLRSAAMLLGVVVPVHRVQGYLRAAIESVLDRIDSLSTDALRTDVPRL
ncbi:hypothetical protein ACFU98_16065 [Streptomyces sp. NPDC057575]|uniref:hypothetical protein n=1 Tax=unclassified Streptomyces TaxID=2593676 RepID=UPI0036A0B475